MEKKSTVSHTAFLSHETPQTIKETLAGEARIVKVKDVATTPGYAWLNETWRSCLARKTIAMLTLIWIIRWRGRSPVCSRLRQDIAMAVHPALSHTGSIVCREKTQNPASSLTQIMGCCWRY